MAPSSLHPQTLALHGGSHRADPSTQAVAIPIFQTTSYLFHGTDHAERMFSLQEIGYTYTRTANPTRDTVERRLAAIEGGQGALLVASGTAARLYALLTLAGHGDNIVAAATIEGAEQLRAQLALYGIELRLVGPDRPDAFAAATDDATRAFFAEPLAGPGLVPVDLARLAGIGRGFAIPLIVDNSALPLLVRPLDHGVAAVIYSGAGFLAGSTALEAGAIVDGGRFDWQEARTPSLTGPEPSYHGAVWTEVAARFNTNLAFLIRARLCLLRDLGAAVSPFEAFALAQGLETLALRLPAQSRTATLLANWLKGVPGIDGVAHPGFGALVSFRPAGGAGTTARILAALKVIRPSPGLGDTHSLAGPWPGDTDAIRLSVGLEHPEDLIDDLARAIAAALAA